MKEAEIPFQMVHSATVNHVGQAKGKPHSFQYATYLSYKLHIQKTASQESLSDFLQNKLD